MPSATVTRKGQITLPKAIRDQLRLCVGDRVDLIVTDDGTVVLSRHRGCPRSQEFALQT